MTALVALLRAVNVGDRQVRSAALRDVATGLGHTQVVTHLASGNLVLVPADPDAVPDEVAAGLSAGLAQAVGFAVPVLVRTLAAWEAAIAANPYPEAADEDPARLTLVVWDGPVRDDAADAPLPAGTERVTWGRTETYAWYPDGIGRSRLTIDRLERAAGRTGTARNWRTVLRLRDLAAERDG